MHQNKDYASTYSKHLAKNKEDGRLKLVKLVTKVYNV